MDVVTMTVEVLLIPNLVLPKSSLSNNEFPVFNARGRGFKIGGRSPPYSFHFLSEGTFYFSPSL